MKLEQLAFENRFVVFDSSALHLYEERDSQNNVTRLQVCAKKTEALRFIKNYAHNSGGIHISEMTFGRLKSGGFHYEPKGRRTDEKHFSLIKETPEERKSEYELKRQIKKENEARHSLSDIIQIQDCVLKLTETEKSLYEYLLKKYEKLKFDFELSDVQYDFLTTGFVVSIERGKTALVSNNKKLTRFYIYVISSNGIIKPKKAALYRRVENDIFIMTPLE